MEEKLEGAHVYVEQKVREARRKGILVELT
jgi:hypothetical protein